MRLYLGDDSWATMNVATSVGASVLNLAELAGIPVMSYFCAVDHPDDVEPRDHNSPEVEAMLAVAFSPLRQMAKLAMPRGSFREVDTMVDLSRRRFTKLDGILDEWTNLVDLLRDLVPLCPESVVVVLAGLERADRDELIEELAGLLRDSRFKVLFTTSGPCPGLEEATWAWERVRVVDVMGAEASFTYAGPAVGR